MRMREDRQGGTFASACISRRSYQPRLAFEVLPRRVSAPGTGRHPVRQAHSGASCRAAASRNPMLLFRLPGVLLLRYAERQFLALLFQLPPRIVRFEALG
jgi:hypothetical protein